MAKKLTEKALIKKLEIMSQVELIKIITELFKTNKVVEARLNLMIIGDEYGIELLEKYKKQLYKIFFSSNIVRAGFSLERAKLVLSDFSNICGDSKWYGDIDAKFYDALGDAYHEAVTMASENEELYRSWKDRLEYIYHEFSGFGWGMDDYITGEYYSIPWLEGGLEDGDY